MSRAERTRTESELKAGLLPAVVATSSLELGIDMGAIDLVVQVGSPPSVASGLQRVGRAGHQVGAVSRGIVFPTFRGELVPAAVTAQRMRDGALEAMRVPRNPLDVLAQQIVAMVAVEDWSLDELSAVVRRASPFSGLGEATLRAVLDMLAGRYPSEEFAELRPRIVWDRVRDVLSGRPGALRLAVTSGGTIPDRGLFGVFLAGSATTSDVPVDAERSGGTVRGGKRVGELDEEMVYESRVGDMFTLGSSTWRIDDITPDRVLVTPAPGVPGRLPFWKGDAPGRPAELGQAMGAWVRELSALPDDDARARVEAAGLDAWAADNLLTYLREQREATGELPSDIVLVVERFRDELGDWRVVLHSPYGARVHAPWAIVIGARLRERYGVDAAAMHSDDGIVLRLPDMLDAGDGSLVDDPWAESTGPGVDLADLMIDPDEVLDAVKAELGSSAMFGARFREAASRALLLPRRRPDRRQPLWQQRQRSAQLLSVASEYPDFPILLEAVRECLQDDFDTEALTTLMRDVVARRVRVVEVTTTQPSPFAQSLLFGYTAQFLYDGDAPLAERRAAALTLDPTLLAELLGQGGESQLADLLDPEAVVRTEAELSGRAPERQAGTLEQLADAVRRHGPLTASEVAERTKPEVRDEVPAWLVELEGARRLIRVRLGGVPPERAEQWAAIEDAGRLRDALGRRAARRRARGVHRARPGPGGRPAAPVRPDARAVHRRSGRRALRLGGRRRDRDPAPAGGPRRARAGPAAPGRARRHRRRVLRRRRAADAAPPVARRAAGRGGARRPAGARRLPAAVAGRAAGRASGRSSATGSPARRGRRRARRRAAGRGRHAGVGARDPRPAGPRRRLQPRDARRAHRRGRGGLGGARCARRARRAGLGAPHRRRGPHAPRRGRVPGHPAARRRCSRRSAVAARGSSGRSPTASVSCARTTPPRARRTCPRPCGTSSGPGT